MVLLLLILQAFILWKPDRCTASLNVQCPQAIFSFGDSLSDTGNAVAAFPTTRPVEAFPYGQTYFHHPAKRYSDGRLVIDFIAQAFGFPFLAPYLQAIEPDYRHGVNFASSGATARSTTIVSPFNLQTQVNQLISFRKDFLALQNKSSGQPLLPAAESFSSALYILSIGFNDFWQNWKYNHVSFPQMEANVIPGAVQSIKTAVQELYAAAGARNFVVFNVPAMGCIPQVLSSFGSANGNDYAQNGCLLHHNNLVSLFNGQLRTALAKLRQQLPDATLFSFDYYAFHNDSVINPQDYGFYRDTTLVACCGGGGKYNDPGQSCGPSTKNICLDPFAYISWDGLHFTEGFNRLMAQALLTAYNPTK
ncbi:hypothetical protein O6H91_16G002600 [Diphasiastrum complanatum]|uniref:Uncharacterized protein n=1 Tax=Diphasiastrum complanatum TaxID=34168 RepID=A0ACC2B9B4_DIPCM|nr:hypothetical protein O6H91_16G002600 [Diphasiastrum complanatum]